MNTLALFLIPFRRCMLTVWLAVGSLASAQVTVTWQAATDFGLADSFGSALPTGNLVKLGTFTVSDATIQANAGDYTFLSSNFVTFDTAAIGDGTGIDGYWTSVSPSLSTDTLGVAGARMYLWAFNSASGATATEQGVFTSSLGTWVFPGDNDATNFSVIELNEVDSIIIGTQGSTTFNLAAVPAAVPEPATTAALAALGALVLAWGRRRFIQQRLVQSRQL